MVTALSRKDQRRQERKHKKKKQKVTDDGEEKHKKVVVKPKATKSKKDKKPKHKETQSHNKSESDNDPYANLPPNVAAAMRRDDEEIAALEAKMGLSSSKDKSRLHKEYAKLECYGDDFGNFLDDVDNMVMRVVQGGEEEEDYEAYRDRYGLGGDNSSDEGDMQLRYLNDDDDDEEDDDDEIVPMKDAPSNDEDLDQEEFDENAGENSSESEDENHSEDKTGGQKRKLDEDASDDEEDDEDDTVEAPLGKEGDQEVDSDEMEQESGDELEQNEPDHKATDTYRPLSGEDIYGNRLDTDKSGPAPKKYVPPHLRKQQTSEKDEKAKEEEEAKRKMIRRSLNNALNRLSEDTLISVSQSVAELYQSNPTPTVNECLWKNLQIACVERPHLMTGLTPAYVACVAGVHFQKGESAQLGEYILEMAVTDLWKEMEVSSKNKEAVMESGDDDVVSKEASNLMLVVCYLYNYGIVHCSFLYSVIRRFIDSFQEIEVELLLLILSHCGRALRSDDPLALKEIVMLVQKRALEVQKGNDTTKGAPLSSRVEYMVSAMMDLKNNKKRLKDTAYADKVAKLRKLLGQVKSASSAFKSSESGSLRIGLDDILNVSEKGRWWKIGASWVGNQYRFSEDGGEPGDMQQVKAGKDDELHALDAKEDAKLLKLAAKARMNTDSKRAIFCIIMKSADCEDAFEKLTRAGHLKNRKERDAVRVLMECCGNEKSYNPFYAHLAARMCDYQPQCKFSMQLAYWDFFKQFDDSVPIRKAANLAKLLFHLVVAHPAIRLGVLKVLDLSSPDELTESAMIFLTIFFTNLLEYFEDPADLKRWLEGEVKKHCGGEVGLDDEDDVIGGGNEENTDDDGGLGPSISIFLLQTLKASPKYKKGSKFRTNLKAAVKACDTEDFFM